ncbi:sugar ABC transporter ATP-binding protein [Subtercola frigoramans]|uniref:Simple sugar transport system ATP-binding protein n=1 Tax=Subtercola frigoramans TaxID=120298 RepID=A0ABS2L0Q6_9MICO|nr:sugar ABC transporter ATP-binding protein [Subtercola frigoramans]MBM7470666.1 simple sugar transport system ATP-binding protein [Subtercola frigoramans]
MRTDTPVLELRDATVEFGGVRALDNVSFRLFAGEIHSLIGENGAGKSTLVKALTGVHSLAAGSMMVRGIGVSFRSPSDAQRAGIQAVHQEIELLTNLSVAENIMLGREHHKALGIDWRRLRRDANRSLRELGLDIDPRSPLGAHSLAEQQLVAIARALAGKADILILDEPTSGLDQNEVSELFRVLHALRRSGVAVLFISHFLEQVYEVADRLTILRDGRSVGEFLTSDILRIDVVEKMTGVRSHPPRALVAESSGENMEGMQGAPEPFFRARRIGMKGVVSPFDLFVAEGEVVGIAGLLGSGRSELARLIAGIEKADCGQIEIDDRRALLNTPSRALSRGVAYSSDNRALDGIIGELSVGDNILLALQAERGSLHRLPRRHRDELVMSYIAALDIRPRDPAAKASTLSGGNQQKVLLARLLALAPRLLVLDEPTRGVDMASRAEIQRLVTELAANGMSVILISAEFRELIGVSDRIGVMKAGKLEAMLENDDLSEDRLLEIIAYGAAE